MCRAEPEPTRHNARDRHEPTFGSNPAGPSAVVNRACPLGSSPPQAPPPRIPATLSLPGASAPRPAPAPLPPPARSGPTAPRALPPPRRPEHVRPSASPEPPATGPRASPAPFPAGPEASITGLTAGPFNPAPRSCLPHPVRTVVPRIISTNDERIDRLSLSWDGSPHGLTTGDANWPLLGTIPGSRLQRGPACGARGLRPAPHSGYSRPCRLPMHEHSNRHARSLLDPLGGVRSRSTCRTQSQCDRPIRFDGELRASNEVQEKHRLRAHRTTWTRRPWGEGAMNDEQSNTDREGSGLGSGPSSDRTGDHQHPALQSAGSFRRTGSLMP